MRSAALRQRRQRPTVSFDDRHQAPMAPAPIAPPRSRPAVPIGVRAPRGRARIGRCCKTMRVAEDARPAGDTPAPAPAPSARRDLRLPFVLPASLDLSLTIRGGGAIGENTE